MSKINIDNSTQELILKYFDAFSNLYTIISMKRALRIIRQQNPELILTEEEFCNFVDNFNFAGYFYIIAYDDEIFSDEPSKETDILKKFLISSFLCIDDDSMYNKMKNMQDGYRFYVPEKEELLEYSDDFYFEKTIYHLKFKNFIMDEFRIDDKFVDDVIQDYVFMWQAGVDDDIDLEYDLVRLKTLSRSKFKEFKNATQAQSFINLYTDMYNHTRFPVYRGFTPVEVNMAISPDDL